MSLTAKIKNGVTQAFEALGDLVSYGTTKSELTTDYDFDSGEVVVTGDSTTELFQIVLLDNKKDETGWYTNGIVLKECIQTEGNFLGVDLVNDAPTEWDGGDIYTLEVAVDTLYEISINMSGLIVGGMNIGYTDDSDAIVAGYDTPGVTKFEAEVESSNTLRFGPTSGSEFSAVITVRKIMTADEFLSGEGDTTTIERITLTLSEGNEIMIGDDVYRVETPVDNGYTIECNLRKGSS